MKDTAKAEKAYRKAVKAQQQSMKVSHPFFPFSIRPALFSLDENTLLPPTAPPKGYHIGAQNRKGTFKSRRSARESRSATEQGERRARH